MGFSESVYLNSKRPRGDVFQVIAGNRRGDIRITPHTPVPDWYGERIDYSAVVGHLFRLE